MMKRIQGVDSLRAICALWVLFSHFGGPPILEGIDKTTKLGWVINGIYNNLWNGPAAVIVFFVISGFCIHYPQSASKKIESTLAFYIKRLVRISLPMAFAIILSSYFGGSLDLLNDSILWSLVCEIIYYLLYPLVLIIVKNGFSWSKLFFVSFALAMLVAGTKPNALNYPSFGPGLNWILGFPCWILGCIVADWVSNGFPYNFLVNVPIWLLRLMVFTASVVLSILRFHTPIGYPWSLNFFAVLVSFYFYMELQHFFRVKPNRIMEYLGLFSYSIYLVHVPFHGVVSNFGLPNLGYLPNWLITNSVIIFASWVFYLLIERPSHFLARRLAKVAGCN